MDERAQTVWQCEYAGTPLTTWPRLEIEAPASRAWNYHALRTSF